jgi:hypothetical protein
MTFASPAAPGAVSDSTEQNHGILVGAGPRTDLKALNSTFTSLPTTIFEVMTRLAIKHNSVNLGQGFPDAEGPESMKVKAGEALVRFPNQYPPSAPSHSKSAWVAHNVLSILNLAR